MPTEITETELVAGTLRRMPLGGLKFRVPATPTIRYMFWMRGFLAKFGSNEVTDDEIVECYEETVTFLRRYNKDVDEQALQESCELVDLITFFNRCFAGGGAEGEAERPARAQTRGGQSSRAKATTRRRSST